MWPLRGPPPSQGTWHLLVREPTVDCEWEDASSLFDGFDDPGEHAFRIEALCGDAEPTRNSIRSIRSRHAMLEGRVHHSGPTWIVPLLGRPILSCHDPKAFPSYVALSRRIRYVLSPNPSFAHLPHRHVSDKVRSLRGGAHNYPRLPPDSSTTPLTLCPFILFKDLIQHILQKTKIMI